MTNYTYHTARHDMAHPYEMLGKSYTHCLCRTCALYKVTLRTGEHERLTAEQQDEYAATSASQREREALS